MELGVLGPVELVSAGVRVPLGGPKQRLVLGLLAAWRGRVVTLDELIDGLWPEGPQARPRKTVQVYVTRLRRALGADADAIRSEAAGYRLVPGALPVDADAFGAEVRAAHAEADPDRSAAVLRTALGRWRGDAFADLRDCPAIVPSAVALQEQRLAAMFELFEREVARRPLQVLPELEEAVEANPLHEGFTAQLMTAQYRAGRQADALRTYQALRRRLSAELGLEPTPELRDLEGRIVRHELSSAPASPTDVHERQRRRVTVLAAEITAETAGSGPLDPEEELAIAAPVRRAARARIVERGGIVLADAGDGLSACFGYPSTERSVERAVLAAVALRELGEPQRVAVRIGVDTGVVVIEGPGRDDGGAGELTTIAGQPLRAARRLRDDAGAGQILVGRSTADAVAGVVELAPAEGLAAGAVTAVRRQAPVAASRSPGLVGRQGALDELTAIAGRARTQLTPVVVSGPAGIGKTAVAEAFAARLTGTWAVSWLFCDRRQQATTLHPLRPVLPELFADGAEPTARAVVAALRERWAGRDPVLVLDDVDAADPSTLDLLDELPDHLASGLVVLTSRDDGPLEVGGDLAARIALGPLDRATSRQLAVEIARPRRLRLDTLNEIADRSGGVPLHIDALTRAVLGRSGIKRAVPTSLYDSLMSRLDRLGPARALAQRLSVLGPSFDAAEVAHVAAGPVEEELARMVEADVLRFDGGRYRFASALVADAAYESVLISDRSALHASIADAMATAGAPPERLAFHLEAAGRPFEAAVAWRRASASAIRRSRHPEAVRCARQALAALDRLGSEPDGGDTRRRALTNLAIGLQAARHGTDELLEVTEEARRRGVGRDDIARRVLLDTVEISTLHERGDFARATDVAEASVAATEAAGDEMSAAFAHQFLGACLVWRGRLEEGSRQLEQAAAFWGERAVPGAVGGRAVGAMWSLLGLAACFADRPAHAATLLARADAVIPDGDGYGRCLVAATGVMADQLADRPDVVRRRIEPVWALAMDLGSDFWFGWAQALLGWAVAATDAGAGLAMMAETVDDSPTRQTKPYFAYLLGTRLCEVGRVDDGLVRLEQGLALADETGEALWSPLLRLAAARWRWTAGVQRGAVADGERAAADAAANGHRLIRRWHDEWERARR